MKNDILVVGIFIICFFTVLFTFIWEPTDYSKFVEKGRIDFECKIYHEKGLTDKPVLAYIDTAESDKYKLVFNNMNDKHLLDLVTHTKERIVFMNDWHDWEFIFENEKLKMVIQTIHEQPRVNVKAMKLYFPQ